MPTNNVKWYHANRYNPLPCEHCEGMIRHEPWCMFVAPAVLYAFEIVDDPNRLTLEGALMLHGMGVAWDKKQPSIGEMIPNTCPAFELMLEMASLGMACRA